MCKFRDDVHIVDQLLLDRECGSNLVFLRLGVIIVGSGISIDLHGALVACGEISEVDSNTMGGSVGKSMVIISLDAGSRVDKDSRRRVLEGSDMYELSLFDTAGPESV